MLIGPHIYMSSKIRFLPVRFPFDIMPSTLFESVNMCTRICYLKKSSSFLRTPSALSNISAKAIASADHAECATNHDLYDLCETGIGL